MLSPINSIKHFVPRTNTSITAGTVGAITIVDAVNAPASANTFDVLQGAVIKAVRNEIWIANTGSASSTTQAVIIIEKLVAGQSPATFTNMLNLGAYLNKKNILFTFQGILASILGSGAISPIRDWLLIPKGKQRFGLGDKLVMSIASVSVNIATCGIFIYKEYR